MIMQDPASSPDGPGRASSGRRGTPAPSCCGSCAAHPELEVARRHRRHAGRHRGRRPLPEPGGRPTPTWPSRAYDPPTVGRARPRVPRPAPRRQPGDRARAASGKVGHLVDLAADFRLQDPALYPQWYGEAHTAPELLADFAYGLPELFRDEIHGADARRRARAATRPPPSLALAPLVRAGLVETDRHHRRRRLRRVGRRAAAEAHHHVLHRRRGLHRLRPARPPAHARDGAGRSARSVLFTPAPGADEPRASSPPATPGPPAPTSHRRRCSTLPAGRLRRRAVRRGARGLAVDQGHAGLEHRPRHRPRRRAHRLGRGHRRHRQPREGGVGRRPCSAPTCCSACPRPPASRSSGSTRERHRRRAWVQRRGRALRHQGSPATPTSPRRHRRRPAGRGGGRVHPEQDDRRPGRHHQRPPHAHRRPGRRGRAQQRQRQRRHRRSRAWPTPRRCARRSRPSSGARPTRCSSAPPASSASRCRSTRSRGGIAALVAGRTADDGGADGGRGDPHHRHRTARRRSSRGDGFTVGGMAKGAAMLAPNMATMLAVLTTDAAVEPDRAAPRRCAPAVAESFNAMSSTAARRPTTP